MHGYGGLVTSDDRWTTVLVGGSGRELAARLAASLRLALPGYTFLDDIESMPSRLRGVHPENPVNRAAGGGVQLELPPRVRGYGRYWDDLGPDAVADRAGSGRTPKRSSARSPIRRGGWCRCSAAAPTDRA